MYHRYVLICISGFQEGYVIKTEIRCSRECSLQRLKIWKYLRVWYFLKDECTLAYLFLWSEKNVFWEAALLQRQKIPAQSFDPLQRLFFSQPTPQAESNKQFDMAMLVQVNYCSSSLTCHPLWYYLCHRYSTSTILAREAPSKRKG